MTLHNEMHELFGKNLIQASARQVENINISEKSLHFLRTTGLPSEYESLFLKFSLGFSSLSSLSSKREQLYVLGIEYDFETEKLYQSSRTEVNDCSLIYAYICIGIDRDSENILAIDESGLSECFVNTNIICFAQSLIAYKKMECRIDANVDNDEEIHQAIEDFENQLREIDPDVLTNEEGWWLSVINGIYG